VHEISPRDTVIVSSVLCGTAAIVAVFLSVRCYRKRREKRAREKGKAAARTGVEALHGLVLPEGGEAAARPEEDAAPKSVRLERDEDGPTQAGQKDGKGKSKAVSWAAGC
jgi:hypothetical protein